jgi:hypothetical protein
VRKALILLLCAATFAHAQVHFLSGPPGTVPRFFEIPADGRLRPWGNVPSLEKDVRWVSVDYEEHIAVYLSRNVTVEDTETGICLKSSPALPGGSPGYPWNRQWLLDTPTHGLLLAVEHTDREHRRSTLTGWRTAADLPFAERTFALDPMELSHIVASGPWDGITGGLSFDPNGRVTGVIPGVGGFSMGIKLPSNLTAGLNGNAAALLINNSQVTVMDVSDPGAERRILVFHKKDLTWRRLPVPIPSVRAFGQFLATADPSTGTGSLHVYDVDTDRTYTIATNQSDTEILLVENGTVYYRTGERMYAAPIAENGIGPAKLLAADPVIRDAHWVFLKH